MLLLQFVEQHGIQHLILHGLDLPIRRMRDQVRIDLGDLFGDQTVLDGLRAVGERLAVAEGDGTEPQQTAARLAHVPDIFLEPARRVDGAQLSAGIDHDGDGVVVARFDPADAGHEERSLRSGGPNPDGAVVGGGARVANVDVVAVAGGDVHRRTVPDGDVVASRGISGQRGGTAGCVVAPGGVLRQGAGAGGCVVAPGGVLRQGAGAGGRVAGPGGVVP